MTGCAMCADLTVVRYAESSEMRPRPHCGACGRSLQTELVEWVQQPPRPRTKAAPEVAEPEAIP